MPRHRNREEIDQERSWPNRFGERDINPSPYQYKEERGMKHDRYRWEDDIRSEGHIGKGPKGYRRSDQRIKEEICEALTAHPFLDASEFQISVSEGLVTMEGVVEKRADKREAEDVCDSILGVRDVHNHLSIRKNVDGWVHGLDDFDREHGNDIGPGLLKGLY